MNCNQLSAKCKEINNRNEIRAITLTILNNDNKIEKTCIRAALKILLHKYIEETGDDILTIVELEEFKAQVHGNDVDPSNPTLSDEYLPTGELMRKIIKDILTDPIPDYEDIIKKKINDRKSRMVSNRGTTNKATEFEIQLKIQQNSNNNFSDILDTFRHLLGDRKFYLYKDIIVQSHKCINEIMKDHGYAPEIMRLKTDIEKIKSQLNNITAKLIQQNKSTWIDLMLWLGVAAVSGPIVGFLFGKLTKGFSNMVGSDLGRTRTLMEAAKPASEYASKSETLLSKHARIIGIRNPSIPARVQVPINPSYNSYVMSEKVYKYLYELSNHELTKSIPSEVAKEYIRKKYIFKNVNYGNQTLEAALLSDIEIFCDGLVKSLGGHLYSILLNSILEENTSDYLSPREVYNKIILLANDEKAFDLIKKWIGEFTKSFIKHSLFCGLKISDLSWESRSSAIDMGTKITVRFQSNYYFEILNGLGLAKKFHLGLETYKFVIERTGLPQSIESEYFADMQNAYVIFCLMYLKLDSNKKIPFTGLLVRGKFPYVIYVENFFNLQKGIDEGFSFPDSPILELCIKKTKPSGIFEFTVQNFILMSSTNLSHNISKLGIDPNLKIGQDIINGNYNYNQISEKFSKFAESNNFLVL